MMFWPTEAQRYAAVVRLEYEKLCAVFTAYGRVAPSLEVIVEEQRRDPTRDVIGVILRHRIGLG